jgi:uncharacterized protein YoxC
MKLLIATLIMAATAFAQSMADRPAPTFDDLKTYLALTDAQVTSLTAAHQAALTSAKTYTDQIREKQQSLRTLTDATAIANLMAEINALQEKMKAIMEAARVAAAGTLTTAQQAKLKTLQDAAALRDEINQAGGLGLLAAPEGSTSGFGGPGFGPRGFGGPRR